MMSEEDEGKSLLKFIGWVWVGVPATLGWIGYGASWLLQPRFPQVADPIVVAWSLAGGWYALAVFVTVMWALSAR